jgi:hypothetical protein
VKIRTRVPWTHPYGAKSDDKWEESTLIACCSPGSLRLTQRARLGAQRWSFSPIQISSRPGSLPHAPYREFKVGYVNQLTTMLCAVLGGRGDELIDLAKVNLFR